MCSMGKKKASEGIEQNLEASKAGPADKCRMKEDWYV